MKTQNMSKVELESRLYDYASLGRTLIDNFDNYKIKDLIKNYRDDIKKEYENVKLLININDSNSYYMKIYAPSIKNAYSKISRVNLTRTIDNSTLSCIMETIHELEYYLPI